MKKMRKRVTAILLSIVLLYVTPQNAAAFSASAQPTSGQAGNTATGQTRITASSYTGKSLSYPDVRGSRSLAQSVLATLDSAEEGEDYEKNEVVFYLGYDPDESLIDKARETAFSCNGVLVDYEMGVGLIRLPSTAGEAKANAKAYAVEAFGEEADEFLEGREFGAKTVDEAVRENLNDPSTPILEPNYHRGLFDTVSPFAPNDPFLDAGSDSYQYYHHMIGSDVAWQAGYSGNSNIRVAVIDTGVSAKHEDLPNVIQIEHNTTKNLPVEPDYFTHGTHVAGIIAASGNQTGGVGIAPGVTILSYNVNCTGVELMEDFDIISAMLHCVSDKADVVNMSLGDPAYSAIMDAVSEELYNRGITVIAAMGNSSGEFAAYPAGYEHVIAVAATGTCGARAHFSNFGSRCDISAPGCNITSTVVPNLAGDTYSDGTAEYEENYGMMRGTSQATPMVTGAAALYMSAYGNPGPDKMKELMVNSAIECPSPQMGAGIIDVAGLMGLKRTIDPVGDSKNRIIIYSEDTPVDIDDCGNIEIGRSLKIFAAYELEPAKKLSPDEVKWSIVQEEPEMTNLKPEVFEKGLVSIDQNGVLRVKSKCSKYLYDKRNLGYFGYVTIRAEAQNGSGKRYDWYIRIVPKCGKPVKDKKWETCNIYGETVKKKSSTIKLNSTSYYAKVGFSIKTYAPHWVLESSDPEVAAAIFPRGRTYSNDRRKTKAYVEIRRGKNAGKATITARCLDGSGKTVKWTVKNK